MFNMVADAHYYARGAQQCPMKTRRGGVWTLEARSQLQPLAWCREQRQWPAKELCHQMQFQHATASACAIQNVTGSIWLAVARYSPKNLTIWSTSIRRLFCVKGVLNITQRPVA